MTAAPMRSTSPPATSRGAARARPWPAETQRRPVARIAAASIAVWPARPSPGTRRRARMSPFGLRSVATKISPGRTAVRPWRRHAPGARGASRARAGRSRRPRGGRRRREGRHRLRRRAPGRPRRCSPHRRRGRPGEAPARPGGRAPRPRRAARWSARGGGGARSPRPRRQRSPARADVAGPSSPGRPSGTRPPRPSIRGRARRFGAGIGRTSG